MALRTFLVQGMGKAAPYEVQAEDLEIDHGTLHFWVSYEDEPFLALAVAPGCWSSCKQQVKPQEREPYSRPKTPEQAP